MAVDNNKSKAAEPVPVVRKHKPFLPILLLLLIGSLIAAGIFFFNRPKESDGRLEVSGRIEGYETNIGAKVGGRVDAIKYREGELVKEKELVAQISDDDIQAQLRGTEARILKAQEQVESARDKLAVIQTQIGESELRVQQATEDSVGRIRQWESTVAMNEANLSKAKAELIQAQADLNLAKIRKERYEFLVSKEAVTKDEADQVVNTFENQKAIVDARAANVHAEEKDLKASQGQLAQARSSRLSPHIQSAGKLALEKQLLQAQHELKQAEHEVANATADRDHMKANIAYLRIVSPINGVVTARSTEPGAVVVPGQTILSVIDLNNVYLRGFIPEGQIGKVRIGQAAQVFLDARPDQPIEGKIIQIDPQGSFTPENIYFKNDRVKQVFGVKIGLTNPAGYAKPGMPADARITLD
ncbi:MAG: HlyD family efflux transporter periplasmic adaptor subunit [Candidatus Obscuribacterales bacterium]|nr:HlyD family efflux transporter periplasmic adaptor subunit [Candidatus Obscuribacterales bacterium]